MRGRAGVASLEDEEWLREEDKLTLRQSCGWGSCKFRNGMKVGLQMVVELLLCLFFVSFHSFIHK